MSNNKVLDSKVLDKVIYLDSDKKSWVKFSTLSHELLEYSSSHFHEMAELIKIDNSSKVLVYNKNKNDPDWIEEKCKRYFKSYLKTPEFDTSVCKSYMFSGHDNSEIERELPNIFLPYYDYMKSIDNKYNQVVVNYYDCGSDHIPSHRDWTNGMVDDYKISIITLNDTKNTVNRKFNIEINEDVNFESEYENLDIELYNGLIVTMGGEFQERFRHGICPLSDNNDNKRFGITFRQFE